MAPAQRSNPKKKIDLVLLYDGGHSKSTLKKYKKAAAEAEENGYNVLIIGDGKKRTESGQGY